MKKNRGFTLVEIIGVVVVLSIILIIAVPSLTKTLKKNEQNKYNDYIDSLEIAAENYVVDKLKLGETIDETLYITIGDLIDAGYVKNIIKNPENEGVLSRDTRISVIKEIDGTFKYNVEEKYSSIPVQEYQMVEYIESTGTQYINTGILASSKIKLEMGGVFKYVADHTYITGARRAARSSAFAIFSNSSVYEFQYNNRSWTGLSRTDDKIEISLSGNGDIYVGNVLKTSFNVANTPSDYNILIFGVKTGRTVEYGSGHQIYYYKLYEDGVLVRDFVPCYGKTNGEIGLFDLVEGKFYANEGTGTFLKGKDI